jgi:hypothetical protein
MCARRSPRQPDPDPENTPLVVPQPPPPDNLPLGMNDDPEEGGPDDFGDLFALSDESYRDVLWYVWRRRSPGEIITTKTNPNAPIYVAKVIGPIDLDELAKQIGGGSFRLCGYRNGRKFIERPLEIEGPRKSQASERPAAPAAAPIVPGADTSALVAAIERGFAQLEQRVQPPQAPAAQPFAIKDVIEMAKMLKPDPTPQSSPDANVISSMIGMLKQGIELGATREGSGGTDWAAVIEKAMPLAEKLVSGLAMRRGVPPRRPPGQPVPASHAEVVQGPPTEPEAEPKESVRMAAVVDSLARAIESMGTENEIEPADFAATVETVLLPAELSMLRLSTTDGLMAELGTVADSFPILAKPQARAFVEAVLTELKAPPAE